MLVSSSQGNALSIPERLPRRRTGDRLVLQFGHAPEFFDRLFQAAARGIDRDDVAASRHLDLGFHFFVGDGRRKTDGLAVPGFEGSGARHICLELAGYAMSLSYVNPCIYIPVKAPFSGRRAPAGRR